MDKQFAEDLRCPACAGDGKGKLVAADGKLTCQDCSHTFRIEDGIPVMLLEDYVPLKAD